VGQLVAEFLEAKRRPETLRTFVNTTLGETWQGAGRRAAVGDAVQAPRDYRIGTVPDGTVALTAGVDVQKDRLVYEVVGVGRGEARAGRWTSGSSHGDTASDAPWLQLDELLARTFPGESGAQYTIAMMAVDSGYNTNVVYAGAASSRRIG
jgi:phage terminase large subunit GpA-like protein